MPRLSIIVTSYNIEEYIDQCLDSIARQSLVDIEIIAVDDGSSDETPRRIREFAERDPRVVPVLLVENSVGGVATAANAGLERATAPWVGFMDGDDFCEPDMFEKLLDAATDYQTDLAMCRYRLVDVESGLLSDPADESRWADITRPSYSLDMAEKKRFLGFVAVPWRKIYRREMLGANEIQFPVGDYFFEDNPFHWFSVLSARSVAVVPEVLCYHRVARAGQTMATVDERLFRIFEHHDTIRDWLVRRGLSDQYSPALLGWAISQLEWIAPRTPKALRRQLYTRVRVILDQYDDRTVTEALEQGNKARWTWVLTGAVRSHSYAGFSKTLDAGAQAPGPFVSAAYHLRYSGVEHTARLTGRYAINKATEIRDRVWETREAARRSDYRDLMFALVVLENRLESMEDALRDRSDRT